MLEYKGLIDIKVHKVNGLYVFAPYSASGKTYLFSLLRGLQDVGRKIVTYTYRDYCEGISLQNKIESIKPELIMVDRFDCYCDDKEIVDLLYEASENAVVLLDLKHLVGRGIACGFANVLFSKECIEVA